MLLLLAASTQVLLIAELLLRRLLYLVVPPKRTAVQRYADNSLLSSLAAAMMQTATVPLQAVASLLASGTRVWAVLLLLTALFTTLLVVSNSSVYAYSALVRMYNFGVAPAVGALKWLFVLLDFVFRLSVPLWNGWVHLLSQILRRVILPYSFTNVDVLPELLQSLALAAGTLGQSVVTWLGNVGSCTLQFEVVARRCGGSNSTRGADCVAVFSATDARCYAAPNHLAVDLLTPGLFARQAAQSLQGAIANSCGLAAIVLNLAMFPLCDYHLWAAVHGGVNTVLYTVVGMPISTWRRCEALGDARGLRPVHVKVGCTPDWQPVAAMAESALASLGNALDNWMNAAAVLVNERVSGRAHACETNVPLKEIVLDAARAIEGLESVEALQRLQGRGGLPEGETLRSVRVVGLTHNMFGVTDGKSVLYRSAHDGYVLAFGAWPLHVDVRFGLAAVSYGGSSADADSEGSARTGLLGCRCHDEPEFTLLCATAPYVQHIDDGLAGFNASSMHKVVFPDLILRGMTCANTAVRVMPLRWPRRRLATTDGGGGGFSGYDRFSFRDTVNRYTGDADATDSLRLLAARERVLPSGAVEAAIYVQPVCGSENSVTCAPSERANCYPWCMAVVRGGRRAQNITMYNARKWEDNVILPEVDCGVARDRGACAAAPEGKASLVDFMEQVGVVRGRCAASCTPAAVPGSVLSLVPLDAVDAEANATLRRVLEHKQRVWYAVRLAQPIVVAGDVMLGLTEDGARLVVTRLYDIGQSTLQMASERLTLSSNAHAAEVTECATQDDTGCVARAMQEGKVVLPAAVRQVFGGATDAGVVLPAAASRWAVHWAQNPEVAVYNSLFEFCRNATPHFSLTVHSSYNRARVWTMQTMRAVDLEDDGAPSPQQTRSRVSYMRVPYFLGKQDFTERACDRVVGLQIVGVEHLNEQNVLVTVLAARPRDYNPLTGQVDGARTHRYYYLHPGRSDCRRSDDEDRLEDDPAIFSCWRSHASGMWPADDLLTGGVWSGSANTCVRPRLMPQFGTFAVMPFVAYVRILETSLDAICTLTSIIAADPQSPTRALEELFTVQLQQSTFHATVDSAGARLLRVDDIIAAAEWFATFNARLASFAVNALTSVSTGSSGVDKAVAGVRTLVIAGSKVYEGLPATEAPFNKVEEMFKEPIAYAGLHASVAVLTMADGIKEGVLMPSIVRAFMAAQLQLVSTFALVLRLGRVVALRLLQTIGAAADGRQAAAVSVVSAALVESRSIVENEYLDLMRFQCYGFSQMVGSERAWGQALRHMCLLLPDTLEGLMTVGTVLVLEYPVVACACKLGEGDAVGTAQDTVAAICLQRPMPAESVQWLLHLRFENPDRRDVCFAAMDSANARFHSAFDKSYKRLYQMAQHAAQVADALLGVITGDTVACDAFDVSPYVLSIIPEPVDYFSSCVDTDDCLGRCYDEFTAFEQERLERETGGATLGLDATLDVPLESLLFSLDDIEKGRHKPPFQILDAVELPRQACHAVCGLQATQSNRCVLVAGVQRLQELAVAYYCLPMDITQYVFQWPGMEAATLPPPGSATGFAAFSGPVRAVYAATSFAAGVNARDSVIAVADFQDESAPDSNFANAPAQVTRVFWCVPGLPRREILRTSLLSERRLDGSRTVLTAKNYLFKIEHVQVDVADSEEKDVAVRVYGFHMRARQVQQGPNNVQTWAPPVSACVLCSFASSPALFTEAKCVPCADNDVESVQQNVRVCLREDPSSAPARMQYEDLLPCAESLALPTRRASTAGFVTKAESSFAVVVAAGASRTLPVPASTLSLLENSAQNGVYMDLQKNAHARVSIVSSVVYPLRSTMGRLRGIAVNSSGPAAELELITVNAQRSQGAWLHVLSLRIDADGVNGAERGWLRATTTARVHLNCSIHSCGACAHTTGGAQLESLQQLENLCYAAQQCGIERCAGTLVNMRKPLCNLGNVVTRELHAVRVLLQGLWGAIADNVAMIVELTHERRQEYQLKWPEKLVRQEACTAKDTFVSLAATVTSVLGAFSHLMQDVSVHHGFVGSNVDSRVHARYIMVLTATTNMLASVFMWPIYQGLVLQKFFSCTANDVLYQIDTLVSDGQPTMSIRFGDPRAAQAIERAGIAVCLSEDVRQSLQDAGVRVREAGQRDDARSGDATALRVVRKLSDAISSTVDVGLSAHVQYAYHVMDIWLTWGASLLKGMMDVAQTVDWQNCKLPVIDSGLQSLGLCACGDEPHAIPAAEKSKTWTQHGFWCSGLLMLNEGDGSDLLVWNPYSLEQLLALKGKKGQGYADYVLCLRGRWDAGSEHHESTCEEYKPRDKRLDRQGVEVLQVISRCRGNYQQSRWDEASALLALFDASEWQNLRRLFDSASARSDDKYVRLRKQVVQLLDNDADLRPENALVLPQTTLECLQDALRAGMLQHDCHRGTTTFAYERAVSSNSVGVDACRVLSGGTQALRFPRFLWTGNSRNHVPLAKLHHTLLSAAERRERAEAQLTNLLAEVSSEFDQLLSTSFAEELRQRVRVESFSTEGDELHQLIDCVVLGPYSAADLNVNVHSDGALKAPVPQYHRGNAQSREFSSWGETGGSSARKSLIRNVFDFVNEKADDILMRETGKHLSRLATLWLDKDNYRCMCTDNSRDFRCCSETQNNDLRLQSMIDESLDIDNNIQAETYNEIVNSKFLTESLWTRKAGDSVPLEQGHRAAMHAVHLFANAERVPVRTYDVEDTAAALNEAPLWETCTTRVAGLFATLPFTTEAVASERKLAGRTVHTPPNVFAEFDPSVAYAENRVHSMELLIDAVLERSRASAPHFWTHAHRYVASDSVWCEGVNRTFTEPPTTTTPTRLKGHELRPEPILAPDADQLVYPADVLQTCACGWARAGGACYVPDAVCAAGNRVFAQLADNSTLRDRWDALCAGAGAAYTTRSELLVVLQVLQELPAWALENCTARRLSTAWGLLAPEDEAAWYSGNSTRGAWRVSAQHLATFGPGGLRLGMLSPEEPERMQEYVRAFELGERLTGTFNARTGHTIAQPVCNSTLREHLTDDLRRYFPDVFVPMAHAVQIVPPVEYCARWALEHAMSYVLRRVAEAVELPQEQLDLQQSTARTWRDRCAAQMHEVGLCALRGVYDIVPDAADVPASRQPAPSCPFAGPGHSVAGCARLYYTAGCLLYCDGAFYDPCLCGDGTCAPRPFAPESCAAGRLQDGRQLLHDDEVLLTSSMTLPADILPREAANDSHWLALRQSLAQAHRVSKFNDVDFDTLFARSAVALLARADEEDTPHSYCDDLFDYWPDVQHPVGYHPSTACSADASRTRGFDAWMSRNASGHALLDPVRMRNMTLASQVFGAAHLVCDAHAYAAPGHRLNPYYMQSRWDAQAHADPAVPVPAQEKTIDEMPTLGRPSFAATDTTLRGQGHSAELLLEHSVGLVRAWAQWFPLPEAGPLETAAAQELLDTRWPHWLPDETVRSASVEHGGLYLGDSASPPPGCRFPRLQRCERDDECRPAGSGSFRCLLNFNEDENTRRGVCMPASSCYQHAHCAPGRLCSGEGSCVEPQLFVLNRAGWNSEIQLFGKGCNVSMRRLSRFESVADFARANGMCSFRDWYHYKNATAGAPALDHLKSVPNRLLKRTDLGDEQSLESLAVLKTLSHPCDRSYAHTDLGACFLEGPAAARVSALGTESSYAATTVAAARTWQLKEGAWHARFCALQGGEKSGFLSPFPDNTLRTAARDIQRCSKLGLCPSTSFHVRGKAVEGRRVRVHELSEDSANGVRATNAARDYCGLDAQRCWGMGFLLGQDCGEVDEERSTLCVVDELVLPLVPIVYNLHVKRPVFRADFDTRLAELRTECVDAFIHTVNGKKDAALFEDVFHRLTQPYAWTDAVLRQQVLEYANGLLLQLFGVTQDARTRGFTSVDEYLEHSRCATYVARALAENEERFAKAQAHDRIQFYQSSSAEQPLLPAAPVLPGASLYLVDRRLPVSVNLRWMLQCVVLAKDTADGGASASFLADLNSGRLSATRDVVDCANYGHDDRDTEPVKLHAWLRRAKFLFTQVPSPNLHPLQVSADVYASIARAIAQLPVLGIPDLTCVSAPEGWQQNTFTRQNALANLHRFRNTALKFDVQAQATSIDTTQRIFADAGDSSVYEQVLQFLVKDTTRAGQPWTAEYPVTLQELETAGVLENMHIYEKLVAPGDMYPRFRYANLAKLGDLYKQTQIAAAHTLATYTLEDTEQRCKCTKEQQDKLKSLCEHRRLLRKPEYSLLSKVRCQDLRLLPCKALGVERLLDDRRWMDTPFLTQDELLYLVLLIFQYEISYTASGGFTTLHRLRDPEQAQFVDELFGDTLPENNQLSLHEARQFNEYLERHDAGTIKCPPTELDFFQETNKRHQQLRQCRDALREQIGWGLPSGHMLTLRPRSDTLFAGFFLAHMERPGETFLDTLFDTNWTTAAHTSLEHAICSVRPEATEVMAPFWAEYFDVASDDSAAEPSLACDFEPASAGSILMVYDTLCSSSVGSPAARATCSEHPVYKDRLENLLPAVCAQQDGRVVVRRRLGALKKGRLCDMRPEGLDAACRLRHGALNGHVGEYASNLDEARVLETTQRGFWNPANTAFRGRAVGADALTALALREDDIAGHCLAFDLDASGMLALRRAALRASCAADAEGSDVGAWLADVEQEWAWDHALAAALHAHNESEPAADVAWTCPLHWLQRYHDDDGRHQARSPSWQRNAASFAHITGAHEYAHPTVRHARRLRGLRAPRFLADGLACVAAPEHCHAAEFLNRSVADALRPAWRPVAYVPAGEPECPRTLDWPADCGKATPDGDSQQPGQCVLRN